MCSSCCAMSAEREVELERRKRLLRSDPKLGGGKYRQPKPYGSRKWTHVRDGYTNFSSALKLLDSMGLSTVDLVRSPGDVPGRNVVIVEDRVTGEPRGTRTLVLDHVSKRWRVEA